VEEGRGVVGGRGGGRGEGDVGDDLVALHVAFAPGLGQELQVLGREGGREEGVVVRIGKGGGD